MTNVLNFDIYAMTQPKSRDDIEALAEEALNELAFLNGLFKQMLESAPAPVH